MFATLGVTLGCVLAFGMARYCGRSFVERRYGGKAAAFNRYAVQRPFILAILIRLFPSGNNLVFSLLAGVSGIPAWPFFLGSCLGYIPQNLLFAMIGSGMRVDEGWRIGSVRYCLAPPELWDGGFTSAMPPCTRWGHGTNIERLAMKRK